MHAEPSTTLLANPGRDLSAHRADGTLCRTNSVETSGSTITTYHADGRTPRFVTTVDLQGRIDDRHGVAAERHFGPDGALTHEVHFAAGAPADLPDGIPANRKYHPDGSVAVDTRMGSLASTSYRPGTAVPHLDPRDGSTVLTTPSHRGGRCISRGHPWHDANTIGFQTDPDGVSPALMLHDGPGGEPAVRYLRADGSTSSITHYSDGLMRETIDYDRDGRVVAHFPCAECGGKPCHCGPTEPGHHQW